MKIYINSDYRCLFSMAQIKIKGGINLELFRRYFSKEAYNIN